jgi:DnaJ-class molecular chaperone
VTEPAATDPPARCTACRGTGRVISNLGDTPKQVSCPWCDGVGDFLRGHDAQAHWRESPAGEPPPAGV